MSSLGEYGEWTAEPDEEGRVNQSKVVTKTYTVAIEVDEHDAEFIAVSRQDIPRLVAEVERLQRKLRYLCNKDIPHMIRNNGEEFYYEWVEKFEKEALE